MKFCIRYLILYILSIFLLAVSTGDAQNKFKLKPEARGKLCLNCHEEFNEKLKNPFIHTPVKTGECSECHNPHTSSHGKLLGEDPNKICNKCHEGIVPESSKSTHKVAIEGSCIKCHSPHASNNPSILLKSGNDLCFICHKSIGDEIKKVRFKHNPVEKGCINCHDPHASLKENYVLKDETISLCKSCHKTKTSSFIKQHMNYPVDKGNCSSCHNPHGSNRGGILFDNVHKPVASKTCNYCHEGPSSPTPFKTKKIGHELCKGCHNNMINEIFNKTLIHSPLTDKKSCLNCHKPHASSEKNLLIGDMKSLCSNCHSTTIEWQSKLAEREKQEIEASKGKVIKGSIIHNPVQEGRCELCHSSHASNNIFLLKKASIIELCGECHDWSKHSNHPMGEKIVDPREKNKTIQCLSCHRSHGSGNRYLIPFPTVTDLCVQCHKQYRR